MKIGAHNHIKGEFVESIKEGKKAVAIIKATSMMIGVKK